MDESSRAVTVRRYTRYETPAHAYLWVPMEDLQAVGMWSWLADEYEDELDEVCIDWWNTSGILLEEDDQEPKFLALAEAAGWTVIVDPVQMEMEQFNNMLDR